MRIVYSAELEGEVLVAFNDVVLATERPLEAILEDSRLRDLDVLIRYVPIIMGERNRLRYPARSRLDRKNRAFNCSPQLPIEPFLTGTPEERISAYLNGLRECGPALKKLGANAAQVEAFGIALGDLLRKQCSGQ